MSLCRVHQVMLMVKPAGVWQTTFGPITLNSNSSDFGGGNNIRMYFTAAQLSTSGSKVRITFNASSAANTTITSCYVGHAALVDGGGDFDGTQVRVTFDGGSSSTTITANTSKVSDEITYTVDETKPLYVSMFFNGGAGTGTMRQNFATPTTLRYTKAGSDESAVTDVSGYATASVDMCISLIEVLT